MVYKENFVAVIKCNGKILREQNESVRIPFGSEFTIFLKNLYTTRAGVSVFVDGKDVLHGRRLIVEPNNDIELEGFMDQSGSKVSHKFKFVEKTQEISDFRGDRADDGIIRVEYQFEEKPPVIDVHQTHHYHTDHWHNPWVLSSPSYPVYGNLRQCIVPQAGPGGQHVNSVPRGLSCGGNFESLSTANHSEVKTSNNLSHKFGAPVNDDGITVKGSSSSQTFRLDYLGKMEAVKHVINISLRGKVKDDKPVVAAVTVDSKLQCDTCGRKWKSDQKFCGGCGNSLT